jgi:exo-beta-1,3-glucanase (GH17 family)
MPESLSDIQVIARNVDFVVCIFFPPPNTVRNGTKVTAKAVGKDMLAIEEAFKQENKNITVTWETGWPSSGVSQFGSKNTVRNLQSYWKEMDAWASATKRHLYLHSAFDEPWRTDPNSTKDISDPGGPNGAESKFGWWYLDNNDDIHSFKEKIPGEFYTTNTVETLI